MTSRILMGALLLTLFIQPTAHADEALEEGFSFGSYGRVVAGSDLKGGTGRQVQVISRAPRLLESSYLELDFAYDMPLEETGSLFRTRVTLAFAEQLFHFTSDFEAAMAIRNLYLEVEDAGAEGLSFWAGSRMYRGDDIYLFDFWPVDEQNTLGGGAAMQWGQSSVKVHVGLNRLDDDFQFQLVEVPGDEFGSRDVLFLDRQRFVSSLRGEQHFALSGDTRLKATFYGELHNLAAGTRLDEDDFEEQLPSEVGVLGGFELGLYGFGEGNHANLFVRFGSNLAAYDELSIPTDLDLDDTTSGAREFIFGWSANLQNETVGLMTGGYTRYFQDADPTIFDRDDVWEFGAALRPAWFVTDIFHLIGESSVQVLRPNGVFQETGLHEVPVATQFALMPSLSFGRGSYARPQLRLIYALTLLNDSARLLHAPEDPLRDQGTRHFLGFGIEWWFNSTRG